MKTLTPAFGLGLLLVSSLVAPLGAQAKPLFSSSPQQPETLPNSSTSLPDNSVSLPKKMAAYKDCINANANVNGADFKQVNKFCSCVADQSIQGSSGSLSECATANGGGGGGAMGVIGEVAPSVISGVMEGLANRSSSRSNSGGLLGGGGGILSGLGDLLGGGGGLLGGGGSSGGGFNIRDLLKNRF
jgi:hypothetical protein